MRKNIEKELWLTSSGTNRAASLTAATFTNWPIICFFCFLFLFFFFNCVDSCKWTFDSDLATSVAHSLLTIRHFRFITIILMIAANDDTNNRLRFQVRRRPNTLLWSFHTQLYHQGLTLVLESGPHKDRESSTDWATRPEREKAVGIWDGHLTYSSV